MLDIGSGTGDIVGILTQKGYKAEGIDQSSDQAGNVVDSASGTATDSMGPYNTMKGYSGLNEDF